MKTALIIVDIQNDFCEGGSLEVPKANECIPVINKIREQFGEKINLTILTQDFHPEDHISFSNSPFRNDQDLELDELTTKWRGAFPPHCIKGSTGAEFYSNLFIKGDEIIIRKGEDKLKENFSGFGNPLLLEILKKDEINRIIVVGLAYDFCVGETACDSALCNFETYVISDASKGIYDVTIEAMNKKLEQHGVKVINYNNLSALLV